MTTQGWDNIGVRVPEGFYQTNTATKAEGWPQDSNTWAHLLAVTHTSEDNYHSMQFAGGYFDNDHFFARKVAGNLEAGYGTPWRELWHDGNFNPERQTFGPNRQLVLETQTDPGNNKSRLRLYRPDMVDDHYYADLLLERSTVGKNFAGSPGVTSQLRVNTDTGSGPAYQWAILSSMNIMEASAAQHCALYGQVNKKANAGGWALCLEMRNHFGNTTTSAVAAEIGVNSNGLDDYNCVIGVDLVYNSGTPFHAGDNVVSAGLRIGPAYGMTDWSPGTRNSDGVSQTTGRSILKRGVEIAGNVQTGIDLTRMVNAFSTEAIKLSSSQLLRWTDGSAFGFNGDGMFLNVAPGALRPGRPMPASTAAGIVVNVGGLGPCLIPLIPL